MKKGILGLGLLLFVLVGCSEVQDDLLTYLNEDLAGISQLEADATEAYGSVTGLNYTDDQTLYNTLMTEVLPKYEEFFAKLKAIEPGTEEVKQIHQLFVEGVDDQYNAMLLLKIALETQDPAQIDNANALLDRGATKINQYHEELDVLAEEHDVEIID